MNFGPSLQSNQYGNSRRVEQGQLQTVWSGNLPESQSALWRVGVVGRAIPGAPVNNGPQGARAIVTFGQSRIQVTFDVASGTTIAVPAGWVQVDVDCRTTTGPDVSNANIPSGDFAVIAVPGASIDDMRAYVSFRTGNVIPNATVDVNIPPFADAFKVYIASDDISAASPAFTCHQRAASAPFNEGMIVTTASGAGGFTQFPWAEILARSTVVRVINTAAIIAAYKVLFRIKW